MPDDVGLYSFKDTLSLIRMSRWVKRPTFPALKRRRFAAFDLLELNGEDYGMKPLAERKKRLARLLARPRDGIEYVEHLEREDVQIFEHACKLGLGTSYANAFC